MGPSTRQAPIDLGNRLPAPPCREPSDGVESGHSQETAWPADVEPASPAFPFRGGGPWGFLRPRRDCRGRSESRCRGADGSGRSVAPWDAVGSCWFLWLGWPCAGCWEHDFAVQNPRVPQERGGANQLNIVNKGDTLPVLQKRYSKPQIESGDLYFRSDFIQFTWNGQSLAKS
jgi:hypothetical protein